MPNPPSPLLNPWPAMPAAGVMMMGIVNVTPDSFSDGGHFDETSAAIGQAQRLAREGAHIVDIGGESTRPFHTPISVGEELVRIRPVLEGLRQAEFTTPISVDTYKAETARAALAVGAVIINDVWGLHRDPAMAHVVAEHDAGLVIMHNRTAKDDTLDIVADIERFFESSLERAHGAGIRPERIALDPGIGFGKSFEQNLVAIRAIPRLRAMGFPILLGVSRKSFLGLITDRPVDARLPATIAADIMGMMLGASILRVHDVAAHRDAIAVVHALHLQAN